MKLSQEQVLTIAKKIPTMFENEQFVAAWMTKSYMSKIKNIKELKLASQQEIAEQRQNYIEMVKDLAKYEQYTVIKVGLLEMKDKILELDILLEDPSLERFLDNLYGTQGRPKEEALENVFSRSGYGSNDDDECQQIRPQQRQMDLCVSKGKQMQQDRMRNQRQVVTKPAKMQRKGSCE